MDFERARSWIVLCTIVAGVGAMIVAAVLARRRRLVPSRAVGWMVTDAVQRANGHPSTVVIDCFLCVPAPVGRADMPFSFTVQAKAGDGSHATIDRLPHWSELRARTATRTAAIVGVEPGVWRVDTAPAEGSILRIRLYDVDVAVPPRLMPSTPGIAFTPLDRQELDVSIAMTLFGAFQLPVMAFGLGMTAMGNLAVPRWSTINAVSFVIGTAGAITLIASSYYRTKRFGGLIISRLTSSGFRPPAEA